MVDLVVWMKTAWMRILLDVTTGGIALECGWFIAGD